MEKIQKIISLEQFKSRTASIIPTIDMGDGGSLKVNWGNIPKDIIFTSEGDYNIITNLGLPFVDGYGNRIIESSNNLDSSINVVLSKQVQEKKILRYKDALQYYYYFLTFFKEIEWYRKCTRKGKSIWLSISVAELVSGDSNIANVDDFKKYEEIYNHNIYKDLPEFNDIETGDIIGVHSEKESFFKIFKEKEATILFVQFVEEYIINNKNRQEPLKSVNDIGISFGYDIKDNMTSFFNIPLTINKNIDEMGEFSLYSTEWVAGKRYYLGDICIYTNDNDKFGSSYVLIKGDSYALIPIDNTELFNPIDSLHYKFQKEFKISTGTEKDLYEDGKKDGKRIIVQPEDKIEKYYLPVIYYVGYYNKESHMTEFDESKGEHWMLNSDSKNWPEEYEIKTNNIIQPKIEVIQLDNEYTDSVDDNKVVGQVESKLKNFLKYRIDVDDDGNELPGVLVKKLDEKGEYVLDGNNPQYETYLDLKFIYGVPINTSNVEYNEDGKVACCYGDIINSIKIESSNEDGIFDWVEYESKNINSISSAKTVQFEYYVGTKITKEENKWVIDENKGVRYEEYYEAKVGKWNGSIDGKELKSGYDYLDIDFESSKVVVYNDDFRGSTREVNIAKITTPSGQLFEKDDINKNYNILNSLIYKDEYKIGITTPIKTDINVYVDRGYSAAFERHLILGEVNTMEDLESYRNDYFGLSDELGD